LTTLFLKIQRNERLNSLTLRSQLAPAKTADIPFSNQSNVLIKLYLYPINGFNQHHSTSRTNLGQSITTLKKIGPSNGRNNPPLASKQRTQQWYFPVQGPTEQRL